jgi:hypothetical protein
VARPRRPGRAVSARRTRVETEYDNFMGSNDDDPERAKRFYARHNAARAAINHIEALQKIEGGSTEDRDDPHAMVARARAALAQENAPDESEAEY